MKWLPLILLLAATSAPLQVVDDTGQKVVLTRPARHIVTLAPHATELVLALGLESRLAAVADFANYPPALRRVPRLAALGPLDRERLLQLRPDLVVAWQSGNRPADLSWLAAAGIAVYRTEPRHLADIAAALRKIALLAGVPRVGERAARLFEKRLSAACASRRHAAPLRVYYQIWPDPPMTVGGRHWINELLQRARLANVFADVPAGVIRIGREAVLSRPYDLLLTARPATDPNPQDAPAVAIPPALERPGPRLAEGLEELCRNLPTPASAAADRLKTPLLRN